MNNKRKSYENQIENLLKTIITTGILPNLDVNGMECLNYCVQEAKYIEGVKTTRMASGRIVVDITAPRVTKLGLDYLHPKKDIKFIVASLIALASVICNIIQLF
ncbi:MAG: hypothetical protein EOM54_11650 [Clostridia bacterium]|nr:hypothetical protein [Clostridia bacterium]